MVGWGPGLCGLVTIWALQTWGSPETQHQIWQARVRVFGPEAVGIWRDHDPMEIASIEGFLDDPRPVAKMVEWRRRRGLSGGYP